MSGSSDVRPSMPEGDQGREEVQRPGSPSLETAGREQGETGALGILSWLTSRCVLFGCVLFGFRWRPQVQPFLPWLLPVS